jgi:uncharacterized protein YjbI with pentapeptide repeats
MNLYQQQFTLTDLHDANYTIADFSNNGFGLRQIKTAGFTITDFSASNISINTLYNATYRVSDLLTAQYTLKQLDIGLFTSTDFSNATVSVFMLHSAGYTIASLLNAGYTLSQLSTGGITSSEFDAAGISLSQLYSAGYSITTLLSAGYTLSQIKICGFIAAEFNAANISTSSLVSAGYTLVDLLNAGFTLSQITNVGFTKAQFIAAGYTIPQLIAGGFTQTNLSTAGYVQSDLSPYFYYGPVYTPVIDLSMAVCYTFDSSSNGTISNNAGGIAYNYGTLIGGSLVSKNIPNVNGGGALSVTNTNSSDVYSTEQYAYLGDTITTSSAMTISIWFQTTGVSGEFKTLFDIPYVNDARGISLSVSGTNKLIQQNLIPIPSISGEYLYMNPTIMYTFDRSFNKRVPNVVNWAYDASMVGNASITTSTNNYVAGTGAMTVQNTGTAYGNLAANTASQYIITKPNSLSLSNNATFSIWFNGTSMADKLLSLFDITNTTYGTKGISIDVSGNQIMSAFP